MKKWGFIFLIFMFLIGGVSAISLEITFIGDNPAIVGFGTTYTDAGATLNNLIPLPDNGPFIINVNGILILNLTITKTSDVDTSKIGSYSVTYSAVNSEGSIITATRTVNVIDTTAPVITINGDNPANVEIGSNYTDARATALDDVDGDLTPSISISGTVDTNSLGEYIITYTVSDNAGNQATATRTVNVIEPAIVPPNNNVPGSPSGFASSNPVIIINDTITNASTVEVPNPNDKLQNNPETNPKTGITGKSIIGFIGENKGISIVIGILIILVIAGYSFIKVRIKRKLWGFKQ